MEHFRPSDECRRFYGSLPPQGVPYLAATVANLLGQVLTPAQMLILGNFLSLLTSSLFAIANLQVLDNAQGGSGAAKIAAAGDEAAPVDSAG